MSDGLILPFTSLLGLGRSKRAWKLQELVRQTSRIMKGRADNCIIAPLSFDSNTMTWSHLVQCDESYSSPFGWVPTIHIITEPWKRRALAPTTWDEVDVEVTCSCPAFMYWGPERQSVVQNYNHPPLRGTAELPQRNLRNADGTPYYTNKLCKHLVLSARTLLEEGLPEFPEQLLRAKPGEGPRYEYKKRWREKKRQEQRQQRSRYSTPRGIVTAERIKQYLEGAPDELVNDLQFNYPDFWPRLTNWFDQVTPQGQELVDAAEQEGLLEEPEENLEDLEDEDDEGGVVSSVVRRFLATFHAPADTNRAEFGEVSGEDFDMSLEEVRSGVFDAKTELRDENERNENASYVVDSTAHGGMGSRGQ